MLIRRTLALSFVLLATLLTTMLHAQATPAGEAGSNTGEATTNDAGPAGIIPATRGFNLSLVTTSQHDSSDGWQSLVTPDLAYRFNRHFSADISTQIFDYINVEHNSGTQRRPVDTLQTKHFDPSDTALSGHFETSFFIDYNFTATLGLPTGNQADGLGAGQATYDFNNHFEHSIGIFSPDIELGIGDSSALINSRVRKSYTTVGPIAFFQAGTGVDLSHGINFQADAYEELPLAAETLYSTTGKGKKKVTTAIGPSQAEDNGFLTSLDIPLSTHVILSGLYNRSLRSHIDTAGFSFTFLLKGQARNTVVR